MRREWTPLVLVTGILAVSAASIYVRFAQREADSLVIAAGRLGIAHWRWRQLRRQGTATRCAR